MTAISTAARCLQEPQWNERARSEVPRVARAVGRGWHVLPVRAGHCQLMASGREPLSQARDPGAPRCPFGTPRPLIVAPPIDVGRYGTLLGTELTVDDSFTTWLKWSWGIDSESALDVLAGLGVPEPGAELVLVPLVPSNSDMRAEIEGVSIEIHAGSATRTALPATDFALDRLGGDRLSARHINEWICVFLTAEELRLNPVLALVQRTTKYHSEGRAERVRNLRPVGKIVVPLSDLDGESELSTFRIKIPADLDNDEVMVSGPISLLTPPVKAALDDAEKAEANLILLNALEHRGNEFSRQLTNILENESVILRRRTRRDVSRLRADLSAWTNELAGRSTSQTAGGRRSSPSDDDAAEAAKAAYARLKEFDRRAQALRIGHRLERSRSGNVDTAGLATSAFYADRLTFAYSDADRRGQRRPVVLLLLIAGLELAVAWRLASPTVADESVQWFTTQGAMKRFNESREVVAALLVLFPAALYGDAVRTRPRTEARRRAQLGFTWLLMFGFVAPLVPAVLVVGPAQPQVVVRTLVAMAGAAILLGALASFWTSERQLRAARRRSMRKRV